MTTLSSLVHDLTFLQRLISEEMMQESPYYEIVIQRGVERGVQQGARENSINNILSVLTERFPNSDVQPVAEALESIEDLDRLTELLRRAVKTPSIDKYLQGLHTSDA